MKAEHERKKIACGLLSKSGAKIALRTSRFIPAEVIPRVKRPKETITVRAINGSQTAFP